MNHTAVPDAREGDRLLLQTARRTAGWGAALALAGIIGAAATLLTPVVLGTAVDAALARTPATGLVLALAGCLLAGAAAGALGTVAQAGAVARGTVSLRRAGMARVLALGVRGQRRFAPGDVTSRLVVSAADTPPIVSAAINAIIGAAASAGAVIALWLIDWRCVVAFAVAVPASALLLRRFISDTSALFTDYQRRQAEIAARLTDTLAGIRTVRAAGTVHREIARVLVPLPGLRAAGDAGWRAQQRVGWQSTLVIVLVEVAVLAVAGVGVAAGRISAGQFLAVAAYIGIALGVVNQIEAFQGVAYARSSARRMAELISQPAAAAPRPARGRAGSDAIRLRGVTVRGDDGTPLLRDVDLSVPPGAALAVVGRSGAGKTTLACVIGGLLAPDEGTVEPAGPGVASAFERPFLLGDTVREVIAYGCPAASDADVRRAAEQAGIAAFVDRLPAGYRTPMAGLALSGGEWQRLGLARAFAQDRGILVLDDATSGVDNVTAAQITAAVLGGGTRVVVTHRAATAAQADLVAWLDEGRLRAVAPHETLLADAGYRAVFADGVR